jgi:hypothetical protein
MGKVLKKEAPNEFLAKRIFQKCQDMHSDVYPELDLVCRERNDEYFVDRAKFEHWLAHIELAEQLFLPIARFAGAFAMLQPNDALWILQALLIRDHGFLPFLVKDASVNAPAVLEGLSTTENEKLLARPSSNVTNPATKRVKAAEMSARESQPSVRPTLNQSEKVPIPEYRRAKESLLPRDRESSNDYRRKLEELLPNLKQQLTCTELAEASALLLSHGRDYEKLCRGISEADERVKARLSKVATLPWLIGPPDFQADLSSSSAQSAFARFELLAAIEREAQRALQAHMQLEAFCQRLQESPRRFISSGARISEVVLSLEKEAQQYQTRLQSIAQREQLVKEFLEGLLDLTPEGSVALLRDANDTRWLALADIITGPKPGADIGRCGSLHGRFDILGMAVANQWPVKPELSRQMLQRLTQSCFVSIELHSLLSFAPVSLVQQAAEWLPTLVTPIAQELFLSAVAANNAVRFEYLAPLLEIPGLDGACKHFYRAWLEASRRQELTELRRQLVDAAKPPTIAEEAAINDPCHELIEYAKRRPSGAGNYFKMKSHAQHYYLSPLLPALRTDNLAEVRRRWSEYGGLDRIVENCATFIADADTLAKLDNTHCDHTRRYLQSFEQLLDRWRKGRRADSVSNDSLHVAWTSLERAAQQNDSAASLREAIKVLLASHSSDPELGEWGAIVEVRNKDGQVIEHQAVLLIPEHLVEQTMLLSWPELVRRDRVPCLFLLVDSLRKVLEPLTLAQAVDFYLANDQFLAAQRAAVNVPELCERVEADLRRRREQFRNDHADLFRRAEAVSGHDEYIGEYLSEIAKALEILDFSIGATLLADLESEVQRVEMARDPERQELLKWLRDAGEAVADDAPVDTLRSTVDQVKTKNHERRFHICELEKKHSAEKLPTGLAERWQALAKQLDQPRLWLPGEQALELSEHFQSCVRFVQGRYKAGKADSTNRDLAARVGAWIGSRLQEIADGNPAKTSQVLSRLAELASLIQNHSPDTDTAQLLAGAPLGEQPLETSYAAELTEQVSIPVSSALSQHSVDPSQLNDLEHPAISTMGSVKPPQEQASDVIADLLLSLKKRADEENLDSLPDPIRKEIARIGSEIVTDVPEVGRVLRSAALGSRWLEARRIAAAGMRAAPGSNSISPFAAVFAIAVAQTTAPEDPISRCTAFRHACLAVLATWEDGFHPLLSKGELDGLLTRAVVEMHGPVPERDDNPIAMAKHILEALEAWTRSGDENARNISRLFYDANMITGPNGGRGSARLADQTWEALGSLETNHIIASARSDLLLLLYRLGRYEELRGLASHSPQLADVIAFCINAYAQADKNSSLRDAARVYAAAFRAQAAGRKNVRPWSALFDYLDLPINVSDDVVTCEPACDILTPEPNGDSILQVRVIPAVGDRPATLTLEVGSVSTISQINLLRDEEALLKEKVVDILVPAAVMSGASDVVRLPYRLVGQSIRRRAFEKSGAWDLQFSTQHCQALNDEELRRFWPGADGATVSRINHGFHGREEQIRKLEEELCASDRPHSALLIGQRRIGKTSLLREMVRDLPPDPGRICGAFLDASGLNLRQDNSLSQLFFDFTVRYLLEDDKNHNLQAALRQSSVKLGIKALNRPVWLARQFDPDLSLKLALEGLARWMNKETGGKVPRLALFVDEFDKFIESVLTGHEHEVDKFMWGVREIVQHSQTVALVLAGSGLLRLFVDEKHKPLWGSIPILELQPFNPADADDWKAVAETFLPRAVRDRLFPVGKFKKLLDYAADLTGCVPYFLSMLGYACAKESQGHPINSAVLNRVVERMIDGKIGSVRVPITSETFYHPLEVTLQRLPERSREITKVLLATLARRTTLENPDLAKWRLIEPAVTDPDLAQLTSEGERTQAYRFLLMEGALREDKNTALVRIAVPLTAASVRHDAGVIRQNALQVLRSTKRENT